MERSDSDRSLRKQLMEMDFHIFLLKINSLFEIGINFVPKSRGDRACLPSAPSPPPVLIPPYPPRSPSPPDPHPHAETLGAHRRAASTRRGHCVRGEPAALRCVTALRASPPSRAATSWGWEGWEGPPGAAWPPSVLRMGANGSPAAPWELGAPSLNPGCLRGGRSARTPRALQLCLSPVQRGAPSRAALLRRMARGGPSGGPSPSPDPPRPRAALSCGQRLPRIRVAAGRGSSEQRHFIGFVSLTQQSYSGRGETGRGDEGTGGRMSPTGGERNRPAVTQRGGGDAGGVPRAAAPPLGAQPTL